MTDRSLRSWTAVEAGGVFVAGTAAVMSYGALADYAADVGAFPFAVALATPLLVDGVIFVAAKVYLDRGDARASRRFAGLVLGFFVIVTLAVNVVHGVDAYADDGSRLVPARWSAGFLAAMPPLALVCCYELVMMERRRRTVPAPRSRVPRARLDAVRDVAEKQPRLADAVSVQQEVPPGRPAPSRGYDKDGHPEPGDAQDRDSAGGLLVPDQTLSNRERIRLVWEAAGRPTRHGTAARIAKHLGIAERTVQEHVSALKKQHPATP